MSDPQGRVVIRLKVEVNDPNIEVIVHLDKVIKVDYPKPAPEEKERVLINPFPIIEAVCQVHGLPMEDVMTKSRIPKYVYARRQIYGVLINYKGFTFKEAGEVFDGQDHTTAMWAKRKHNDDLRYVPAYKEQFDKVLTKLKINESSINTISNEN